MILTTYKIDAHPQLGCLIDGRSAGTAPFKRSGRHLPDSCLVRPAGAWPAGGRPAVAAAHRAAGDRGLLWHAARAGKKDGAGPDRHQQACRSGKAGIQTGPAQRGNQGSNQALNALAGTINAELAGTAVLPARPGNAVVRT